MSKHIKPGKRYWFFTGDFICSGLYGGEAKGEMLVLYCKNGDVWSISRGHVYATKKEAVDRHRGCRVFE